MTSDEEASDSNQAVIYTEDSIISRLVGQSQQFRMILIYFHHVERITDVV